MNFFRNYYPTRNLGLLLLRVGIGWAFMMHGFPKIKGGPGFWEQLGGAMGNLGITFAPTFWGFLGAFAEFGGGFLLLLGLFFRPVTLMLFFTMCIATTSHISNGDDFNTYSHALEAGILFISLFFIGPGKISLDEKLFKAPSHSRRLNS
ncbi:DoxX family protein [Adhaeribacter radiodurans]|uniref:DoxX family protein n=1 Tax=Adhaeribacter radiodurans TaxID=2745197 RepID=A0A7L7LAM2_9BACT|nr:DoxX family protein [Adhaeribacter radiodurans]QMU29803.1 DoxX family protein [Adhaeribacter radiodurans]